MHFEILVEGGNDRTALNALLPAILGKHHTWRIISHRGKGTLPQNVHSRPERRNQSLLHNLPAKLRAYGRGQRKNEVIVVLVDLDRDDPHDLKKSLTRLLDFCPKRPRALFRLAIEETEAWFLGDRRALSRAYPSLRAEKLADYAQDSVCGTWEVLADAIHPHDSGKWKRRWRKAMAFKGELARKVPPLMDVEENRSPSFRVFRDGLRGVASGEKLS